MTLIRDPEQVRSLLEAEVIGREITSFEVLAINALKSAVPSPDALVGAHVLGVSFDDDDVMSLDCGAHKVTVDFARTGGVEHSVELGRWRPVGRTIPPTGRLLLGDGSGLDFKEPARTKRITFTILSG